LLLDVGGDLNFETGVVTWTFTSLDPVTLELPDALGDIGFLPPNQNPPEGEGFVSYIVRPKPGLPTGTTIEAQASIVFDLNSAIDTPAIFNTLDGDPPTSSVNPLPAFTTTSDFTVSWFGSDEGAGVVGFTVLVAEDGGPFIALRVLTEETSITFTGVPGRTYAFCTLARDGAGNVEEKDCALSAVSTRIGGCAGDCDLGGRVTVDELVLMVNIALGKSPPSHCSIGDADLDGRITVDELVGALNSALSGCAVS
jgi:hypothetical protein